MNEYFILKYQKQNNMNEYFILSNACSHIRTSYKGSSTKKGNNPKAIKARRKKNKNKKTHRK